MIRILLLLGILGAALLCGPLLAGNKGYVLIAIGEYTIEMTVISAGILALLLYGVLWCTERLLLRLFHIKGSTRRWFSERRRRKARERTLAGTLALAEGQFKQAETLMRKSAPESEQALLNYLSAAEAAEALEVAREVGEHAGLGALQLGRRRAVGLTGRSGMIFVALCHRRPAIVPPLMGGRRPFAEECNGAKKRAMSANAVNQTALKRPW